MAHVLIFDWDGTLHNTEALYGRSFRKAYQRLVAEGFAPERDYTDRELSVYLGMSAPVMWNTFMPDLPQEKKEQSSAIIREAMVNEVLAGKAILYPGAEVTLAELKNAGYTLVFLSNCKHSYMEAHRKDFRLDRFFDGFYCCQDYHFAPKPEIFNTIRHDFPGECIVIGDRASDLAIAVTHHLKSIGCAYGFGTMKELRAADRIADSVSELPGIIGGITDGSSATGMSHSLPVCLRH